MTLKDAAELLLMECRASRLAPATLRFYSQQFKKLGDLATRDVAAIAVTDLREIIARVPARSAPLELARFRGEFLTG
jgi:hypothetical protein